MFTAAMMTIWVACTPPVPPDDSGSQTDTALCTFYADTDDDGFGNPAVLTHSCGLDGYIDDNTDCDDTDPDIHPGADEFCNTLDDDCDGQVDEGDIPEETWHRDRDADGYGLDDEVLESCEPPDGYAKQGGDCDDQEPEVHPGVDETCDGADQDCDGIVDEDGLDASTWYLDDDGDDHGVPDGTTRACDQPDGYAASDDDCDDSDAARFPGKPEICDNIDNDCDDSVDEAAEDAPAWFYDGDGDGYGDPTLGEVDCDAPADHVADATDCDDADASRNPGATEICDGDDDDCDSSVDEGVLEVFYRDGDGDGYGDDADMTEACEPPSDYVAVPGDCDDTDGGIRPGAREGCDGVDEDCDGATDEDPVDGETFYADKDGDGYGDPLVTTIACVVETGWSETDDDCDDGESKINPEGIEVCDSADQDCDKIVDEGVTTDFFTDADTDGYGDPTTGVAECSAPSGTVENDDDCDDSDIAVNPAATEVCDGVDQDCDTHMDEGVTTTYYADIDGDGWGDPVSTVDECSLPSSGYVENDGDCYDQNSAASPDQTAFFSTDRGDMSFDWTCDGVEEEELPDPATCAGGGPSGKNCEGDPGWETGVPACGDTDVWIEKCVGTVNSDGACGGVKTEQTQNCR